MHYWKVLLVGYKSVCFSLLNLRNTQNYQKNWENSNLSVIQGLRLWCQSYTISLTITLNVTRKIACIPWFDATDNYWNPPAAAKARRMVKIVQQPFLTDAPVWRTDGRAIARMLKYYIAAIRLIDSSADSVHVYSCHYHHPHYITAAGRTDA